jgi:hypothetical protein
MNLFGPFVTSIMPSSLAGKPGRRSYRRPTLSMTGNANWRSLTCSLLCFDYVEIASADSNRPLTILRRFLQPAYFFECDAEASFFLSQVSYSYILILVGLSLTLRLAPGSSLSRGLRTWSDFLMLIQKSPVIYQLRSVDSNQPNELVWIIRDLHRTLQLCRQARPSLISLGHSLDIRQRELEVANVFITMFRLRGDRICGFKSSFDDSAPLPPAGLFLRMRRRSIVFNISCELPMYIDSHGTLTDA